MPIYEYHCNACDGEFEVIQKVSDRPIRKCELCGKLRAKRKISRTNFVLKGGGWYATDYGNRKDSRANESSEASKATVASSSDDSSDSSKKDEKKKGGAKKADAKKGSTKKAS